MDAHTFKSMLRWALFGAFISGIIWITWIAVGADVPTADPLVFPGGRTFRFEAVASHGWDPLGVALLAALAAFGAPFRFRLEDRHKDLGFFFCISCEVGAVLGGIGYYIWGSKMHEASAMPFVLLVAASLLGLIMGIVSAMESASARTALFVSILGPLAFCLSATVFAGLGEGYLHALAALACLGIIGATLSSLLCFLTLAILKKGFWSWPKKWRFVAVRPRVTVAQSPAGRLNEIAAQIAALETERAMLKRHPDASRF